jgi:hypothetical protein
VYRSHLDPADRRRWVQLDRAGSVAALLYHSMCHAITCHPQACHSVAPMTNSEFSFPPSYRAERLEIFDEFEEWNMIQVHI